MQSTCSSFGYTKRPISVIILTSVQYSAGEIMSVKVISAQVTTFVEFRYRGMFSSPTLHRVESRQIKELDIPDSVTALSFYDAITVVVENEGLQEELVGKRFNSSPTYYYGGRLLSYQEVQERIPDSELAREMLARGVETVALTQAGDPVFLNEGDMVVPLNGLAW